MPNPLTSAPINEPLMQNSRSSQAWVTWFQLLWQYVRGFQITVTEDTVLLPNTVYVVDSVLPVTLTMVDGFNQYAVFTVIGKGAGGWTIQLNSGQTIHGGGTTTSGGTLSSTADDDTVVLRVRTPNTELSVIGYAGTLAYA